MECTADGVGLKDGVAKDRTLSVHNPEMRHGHKSSNRRFDGHMAAVAVDTGSQLMTAVDVLPGNAPDNLGALELVEQSEANSGVSMEEAMGDAAYGDGDTRQAFADAGRTLVAKVPGLGVQLVNLPGYSPDFNANEAVWAGPERACPRENGGGPLEPVPGDQGIGAGEGHQLPRRAGQPERRSQTALPDRPAVKGRRTPAKFPAQSPKT